MSVATAAASAIGGSGNNNLNTGAFDLGFKKGGRVGCGVAKKGFGKAMKKRRK